MTRDPPGHDNRHDAGPPPTVRVGVGVVVVTADGTKLYAGRRLGSHGATKLALPGGHLELYETWEECAQREVREEMGVANLVHLQFLHVTNDIMVEEHKHYVTIFMTGKLSEAAEPLNCEPDKCEGWNAYHVDELLAMVGQQQLFLPLEHLLMETSAASALRALFSQPS